jgi:hypothetical protein
MKKYVLLILAVSLIMLLGQTGTSMAFTVTVGVCYTGYCDQDNITCDLATGECTGEQVGCVSGDMLGMYGATWATDLVAMGYAENSDYYGNGLTVVRGDGNWLIYGYDPIGGPWIVNTGVWTLCPLGPVENNNPPIME